jgi:hypothetical protein
VRRRDGEHVFTALVLLNASYYLWDGGRALGPRHVVPALGFVGVGIGYAFERFRTTAALLAGISMTIVMLATDFLDSLTLTTIFGSG